MKYRNHDFPVEKFTIDWDDFSLDSDSNVGYLLSSEEDEKIDECLAHYNNLEILYSLSSASSSSSSSCEWVKGKDGQSCKLKGSIVVTTLVPKEEKAYFSQEGIDEQKTMTPTTKSQSESLIKVLQEWERYFQNQKPHSLMSYSTKSIERLNYPTDSGKRNDSHDDKRSITQKATHLERKQENTATRLVDYLGMQTQHALSNEPRRTVLSPPPQTSLEESQPTEGTTILFDVRNENQQSDNNNAPQSQSNIKSTRRLKDDRSSKSAVSPITTSREKRSSFNDHHHHSTSSCSVNSRSILSLTSTRTSSNSTWNSPPATTGNGDTDQTRTLSRRSVEPSSSFLRNDVTDEEDQKTISDRLKFLRETRIARQKARMQKHLHGIVHSSTDSSSRRLSTTTTMAQQHESKRPILLRRNFLYPQLLMRPDTETHDTDDINLSSSWCSSYSSSSYSSSSSRNDY